MSKQTVQVEIKLTSVLVVLATLAGLWLLFYLRNIVLSIFIAFIIASALQPLVHWLKRLRIPQVVTLAIVFLALLGFLTAVILMVMPPLIHEIDQLLRDLPDYASQAAELAVGQGVNPQTVEQATKAGTEILLGRATDLSTNVLEVGLNVLVGAVTAVTILVISFYLIIEKPELYNDLSLMLPKHDYVRVRRILEKIEVKLGSWLRGQLLLGFIIGGMTWLGLTLLGVKYAVPLAVIAGILELVPILGPILAAVPAVIVALTGGPISATLVALMYLIIQQLESTFIVPKVMQRAVGLNPLFVIIALLIGGTLMGILGALISVPVAVVATTIFEDIRSRESDPVRQPS